MKLTRVLPVALAGLAAAQNETPGVIQALSSANNTSLLVGLLQSQPLISSALNNATNITILAPSDDALHAYLNDTQAALSLIENSGLLGAILSYHILNGTHYGSSFTNSSTFIPTHLTNQSYANITGGQRVQALLENGNVTFFTALKENATVTQANLNFTGGTIHVVNSVLKIPQNLTNTAEAANLTAAVGAIQQAGLVETVGGLRDITVFAPSNAAFANIANITGNLTTEQLGGILQYHLIAGQVLYSNQLGNVTVQTASGTNVTVRELNGTWYVNSAKVTVQDVLISNGVVHVIDNVLNPANATAAPNSNGDSEPAFAGAGSANNTVPFTSGVPAPTSTAPVATGANPGGVAQTSTSKQAAPVMTAAMGAAALFGGAAVMLNM